MPDSDFSLPFSEAVRLNHLNYQQALRALQEGAVESVRRGRYLAIRPADAQRLAEAVASRPTRRAAA